MQEPTKETLLVLSCTDKKVPQRNSRPTFRSLINCNAQPKTSELAIYVILNSFQDLILPLKQHSFCRCFANINYSLH